SRFGVIAPRSAARKGRSSPLSLPSLWPAQTTSLSKANKPCRHRTRLALFAAEDVFLHHPGIAPDAGQQRGDWCRPANTSHAERFHKNDRQQHVEQRVTTVKEDLRFEHASRVQRDRPTIYPRAQNECDCQGGDDAARNIDLFSRELEQDRI